ncbi:hypothetical protein JTE90_015465 [Oedothorax gibbosus]|uniref:Transcription termination factor n=1 Tax=Oedothorax gibbosus TaxID=931172 RepID=A0AAV6UAT5_9ARAC|nr:hypothetical protein JTE90_015465 [Oedothorax gibbosus]
MMKISSLLQIHLFSMPTIKFFSRLTATKNQTINIIFSTQAITNIQRTYSFVKPVRSLSTNPKEPNNIPPEIETQKIEELSKVVKFLKSKGCSSNDIKEKCLKHISSAHESYLKALLVSELHDDVPLLLPLMACSLSSLRMAAKLARYDRESGFPSRVSYLSRHLETPLGDLVPALAKHSALLTMPFDRLERKMDILREAGISPRHIIKDLWIFNYKEALAKCSKKAGVELKPWILRCSVKTFHTIIEKNTITQSVLKGEDERDYLARRLDCSREYVEYIMERNKLLKSIAIPKIDKVLNFLYEKGYTPAEVRMCPRVFCSSVQTLNKRFTVFSAVKTTLPTISQLCIKSRRRKNPPEVYDEDTTK